MITTKVWATQNGDEIALKDMSLDHLHNTKRMLELKLKHDPFKRWGAMGSDNMDIYYEEEDISEELKQWIKAFKREIKKRNVRSEEQYA